MARKINPGGPSRLYSSWLKGNLVVGGGIGGPAEEYFVDGTNGNARFDGKSWETAKATIQAGLDLCIGRGLHRVFVAPGTYAEDLTTPLNAVASFGQLIAYNPSPGNSYGAVYLAPVTTACLTVQGKGWYISGFEFGAGAAIPCVILGGATAGNNACGTMIEDCLFSGNAVGSYGIDWQSAISSNAHCTISNCGFHQFHIGSSQAKCITCSASGIDQPRFALIENCWFANSDNLIDMNTSGGHGFKESIIRYNTFYTNGANYNPDEIIDNTGGNDTMLYGNKFPEAYTNAGGYVAGTNDNWAGNNAENQGSEAVDGWTYAVPA